MPVDSQERRGRWPHVLDVLDTMLLDNGLVYKEEFFETKWNLDELEVVAATLTSEEREIIAAGEHQDQLDLLAAKPVGPLFKFVEFCFNS